MCHKKTMRLEKLGGNLSLLVFASNSLLNLLSGRAFLHHWFCIVKFCSLMLICNACNI